MAILTGKIIDAETKAPLAFINVAVDGKIDITDKNGVYVIEDLPEGEYFLRIRAPFYEPYTDLVYVREPKTVKNISLRTTHL